MGNIATVLITGNSRISSLTTCLLSVF